MHFLKILRAENEAGPKNIWTSNEHFFISGQLQGSVSFFTVISVNNSKFSSIILRLIHLVHCTGMTTRGHVTCMKTLKQTPVRSLSNPIFVVALPLGVNSPPPSSLFLASVVQDQRWKFDAETQPPCFSPQRKRNFRLPSQGR